MASDLEGVRALCFDVGGTVFDWYSGISTAVAEVAQLSGASLDAAEFAVQWRGLFFETLAKVRSGELPHLNADGIHRRTLDEVSSRYPTLALSDDDKTELTAAWHRLPAWPDAGSAIERLRARYEVVVLTVLSYSLVLESSKRNGISWDGIISCEFLPHYKPDREAYLDGVRLLQLEPWQCMMVAAHPWDLEGARGAGMRTAYVPRPYERGPNPAPDLSPQPGVDVNAIDFDDLANKLLGE